MPFLKWYKVCPPATSEAGARRQLEQFSWSTLKSIKIVLLYICIKK
jgi:hypothetical protein